MPNDEDNESHAYRIIRLSEQMGNLAGEVSKLGTKFDVFTGADREKIRETAILQTKLQSLERFVYTLATAIGVQFLTMIAAGIIWAIQKLAK